MMRLARISTGLSLAMVLTGAAMTVPGGPASAVVRSCPTGYAALTFDDGPKPTITPQVVTVLRDRQVPATFFVVGKNVRAHPALTRRASALGFTIGNHTFRHENLTHLGSAAIRSTLRRTRQAIVAAGATPSALVRPSYGAADQRVREVIAGMGFVPVLWTVDPRDWDGRSATAIVRSTLAQLDPGKANIVLLHDGVKNSGQTLAALPGIIRGIRARGYCLVGLGPTGVPIAPGVVPGVSVSDASVGEMPGGSVLRATVRLDRPGPGTTSVRVRTVAGSAMSGSDYVGVDQRLSFPSGVTRQVVRVRVRNDLLDERAERFTLRLSAPSGLRVLDGVGAATIRDDDPAPGLGLLDAQVTEPSSGSSLVPVRLRLDRPSGKWVRVTVSTVPVSAGSADYVTATKRVAFAPGQTEATFQVTVLADSEPEGVETFLVSGSGGSNVRLVDPTAVVRILPPAG